MAPPPANHRAAEMTADRRRRRRGAQERRRQAARHPPSLLLATAAVSLLLACLATAAAAAAEAGSERPGLRAGGGGSRTLAAAGGKESNPAASTAAMSAAAAAAGGGGGGGIDKEEEEEVVAVEVEVSGDGSSTIQEGDKFAPLAPDQQPLVLGGDPSSDSMINFGYNELVTGVRKHHPATYQEVVDLVRSVRARGGRLRAMGALHSWSNIFPENGTDVIFMDRLKAIQQDPNDYSIVTVQAGVLTSELADWADSSARDGKGRFSYFSQNTVVTGVTFVGACQTASHGSGFVGASTVDAVIGVTLVDFDGNIRHYQAPDPDVKVVAACLGMCGLILDVTVQFDADTSAVEVTKGRRPLYDLLPPRGTPINESYNPLKSFIEGPGFSGGALSFAPYNSAPEVGIRLDPSKIDLYHSRSRIWSNAIRKLPGTPVTPYRQNGLIGSQTEPYYDKDAFYPADYATLVIGSHIPHAVLGSDRLDKSRPFNPYLANSLSATVNWAGNPSFVYKGFVSFNTSKANAQHIVKYLASVAPESDFEFAFRIEDDYANVYEAQRVLIEENDWMFRNRGQIPLSMFSGLRWTEASQCPLSHVYGKPGDRFALIECIGTQGTDGWEEYVNRVFNRWRQMRSKKDRSLPRPHWAKWDARWVPSLVPYLKEVYGEQMKLMRPVIMRHDPLGLFRNRFLSELFDLPYLQ